eukprot:GFYU01000253.1.p2 GENE.GFYU01000253.1~~GFYU01000253.1.p2  ORF type:complete len:132 (-),score=46.59 GFYU01000253.1:529-882(-)
MFDTVPTYFWVFTVVLSGAAYWYFKVKKEDEDSLKAKEHHEDLESQRRRAREMQQRRLLQSNEMQAIENEMKQKETAQMPEAHKPVKKSLKPDYNPLLGPVSSAPSCKLGAGRNKGG